MARKLTEPCSARQGSLRWVGVLAGFLQAICSKREPSRTSSWLLVLRKPSTGRAGDVERVPLSQGERQSSSRLLGRDRRHAGKRRGESKQRCARRPHSQPPWTKRSCQKLLIWVLSSFCSLPAGQQWSGDMVAYESPGWVLPERAGPVVCQCWGAAEGSGRPRGSGRVWSRTSAVAFRRRSSACISGRCRTDRGRCARC